MLTKKDTSLLNRSHIVTMIMLRNREEGIFSSIPKDVTNFMIEIGEAAYGPDSDIAKLLHQVTNRDFKSVEDMLNANPLLLLQVGDVDDTNIILHVAPYECALGAGDYVMAATIKKYFQKIKEGDHEESLQCAKYVPYIKNMLTQKPDYDLDGLLEIIMFSPKKDIKAALLNIQDDSPLNRALLDFKKHFSSCVTAEGMHFNYQNLLHANYLYASEFANMVESDHSWDKCNLFWEKVLLVIKDSMPKCDKDEIAIHLNFAKGGRKELSNMPLTFSYTLEQCRPESDAFDDFLENKIANLNEIIPDLLPKQLGM